MSPSMKVLLSIHAGCFAIGAVAQSITVTCLAEVDGSPTPLDSVLVMNLTQGGDTMLYYPDLTLFAGTTGITGYSSEVPFRTSSAPNPFDAEAQLDLDVSAPGVLGLFVHDAQGREVVTLNTQVDLGRHRFRFIAGRAGLYLITSVLNGTHRTTRLLCTGAGSHASPSLVPVTSSVKQGGLKDDRSLFDWQAGDGLRFIGYGTSATVHSGAVDIVPDGEHELVLIMHPGRVCPDAPRMIGNDGEIYRTVQIGSQCWIAEDLRSEHYRDGTVIPNITSETEWWQQSSGACCTYENVTTGGQAQRRLYNWYAGSNPLTCPLGWHLPADEDWTILTDHLGGTAVAGGKLKLTTDWDAPNTGATNETGFGGYPAGLRSGGFSGEGQVGNWWSTTGYQQDFGWSRYLSSHLSYLTNELYDPHYGFCLRCLKD